jgi:hypothetical protein
VENAVLCTLDIRFKHQRTRFEAKGKRFVLSIGTLRRALAGLDASTVKMGAPGKENPLACASGLSYRIDVYCDGRMMNCP